LFTEIYSEDNAGFSTIEVAYDTHVFAYCDTTKHSTITAYVGEEELKTFGKLSNKYILDLGYHTAGTTITLKSEKEETLHLTAYSLDEEYLENLVNQLSESTLTITDMSSDKMSGRVSAQKDGYLVLSIPYDPGFTITVDGVQTEAVLFEDMMLAVPITAGEHSISLAFYPQGMTAGILISCISVFLLIGICFVEKRRENIIVSSQQM